MLARILEPPRDLSAQNRFQEQLLDNRQRLAIVERSTADVIHLIGASGEPAFQNSWVHFDNSSSSPSGTSTHRNVAFYRDRSRVYLQGLCKSGTVGATIFTLPLGYRPPQNKIVPVVSNDVFGFVVVASSGTVTLTAGSNAYVALDSVSFRV